MKSNILTRTLPKCVLTALAVLTLAACSDYDNGYTEKQLQFIQNFKDIYGEVDPTQDWNLAERANVTVTVSKPSNIQIFAKADGRYRIVGDYKNVSGTRTLGFDVVEGTKDIMVSDGRTAQYTTLGGSVTFAGTRTIYDKTAVSTKINDYSAPIDKKTYSAWRSIVPEGEFNLGKVVEDFVFVSTGKFTIYPIYWHTNNTPELGIYYLNENYNPDDENSNENELVEIGVYKILYGNAESRINKDENGNALSYDGDSEEIQYWDKYKNDWVNATVYYDDKAGMPFKINWDDMDSAPEAIHSKGIEIDLPVGTVFGMFLIESGNSKFYSNSNRNEKPGVSYSYTTGKDDGETVNTRLILNDYNKGANHACAFIANGHLFLSFEDWLYGGSYEEEGDYDEIKERMDQGGDGDCDFDMNDCIFMFSEDIPMLVDYQAQTWILSAEDLGNTLDIDYNDVVIEVSHTSGRDEAYVTPLAAGGTLASFVYFKNSDGEELPLGAGVIGSDGKEKTGEIHELFSNDYGKTANWISGKYSPINVDKDKDQPTVSSKRTYTIKVDEDWSLATNVSDYESTNEDGSKEFFNPETAKNMGGFTIKVVPENISVQNGFPQDLIAKAQEIQNVVPGDAGAKKENVPYVICTPKYWTREDETGHYRWPRESMPMLQMAEGGAAAYSTPNHRFEDWVRDKTQATDWYKYPDPDNTTAPTGLGINPEASLQGSIGSGGTGGNDGKRDPEFTFSDGCYDHYEMTATETIYNVGHYTTKSDGDVTITNGDESIAIYDDDDHSITAVGAGTTTITLDLEETETYSAASLTITITVVRNKNATFNVATNEYGAEPAESHDVPLNEGETYKIHLHPQNSTGMNDHVEYRSDKEDVATVSEEGIITAHKAGTATITVASQGTNAYEPKNAYIYVTVKGTSGPKEEKPQGTLKVDILYTMDYQDMDNIESYLYMHKVDLSNAKLPDGFNGTAELTISGNNRIELFYLGVNQANIWGDARFMGDINNNPIIISLEILKKIFSDGGFVIGEYGGGIDKVTFTLKEENPIKHRMLRRK